MPPRYISALLRCSFSIVRTWAMSFCCWAVSCLLCCLKAFFWFSGVRLFCMACSLRMLRLVRSSIHFGSRLKLIIRAVVLPSALMTRFLYRGLVVSSCLARFMSVSWSFRVYMRVLSSFKVRWGLFMRGTLRMLVTVSTRCIFLSFSCRFSRSVKVVCSNRSF